MLNEKNNFENGFDPTGTDASASHEQQRPLYSSYEPPTATPTAPVTEQHSPLDGTGYGTPPEEQSFAYHESYPMANVRENIRKKERKPKIWLIATACVVAGALMFAALSPFISGFIKQNAPITERFSFDVEGHNNNAPATPVTYNAENRQQMSAVEIGKLVGPSVVGVVSKIEYQGFFATEESSGSGSGVIFTAAGHIITNYHVIKGAKSVAVILNNGQEYPATLIGGDERSDLAVVKIDAPDLTPAILGDSDRLEAGEVAVAIGNPLGVEFAGTLTQGIISAINRTITVDGRTYKMIQTDAAINPGNSGGALVNAYGEVIGINTVKVSITGVEGLGFAIPMNDVRPIVEDLMNHGYVKGRPLIGLTVQYVSEQEAYYYNFPSKGLVVVEVTPGSGAAVAGIQKGDVILTCNGAEVTSSTALNDIRDQHKAGDTLSLKINRGGQVMDVSVVLGEDNTKTQ